MRSTAFFVNGGAGRIICSIPAFEKYAEANPDDDFIIVTEAGTDFFKGHPTLHNKCFDNWHKGLFEEKLKDRNIVSTEPYRVWHYYNQECSLAQAYDIQINKLEEPRELPDPEIVLSKMEVVQAQNILEEIKGGTGKAKVVVIQPFGRSVQTEGDFVVDPGSRSMNMVNTVEIINNLKKDYSVVVMSEFQFPVEENEDRSRHKIARPQIQDIRIWAGVIEGADHFIGCDSVGQHLAKALDTTATVVLGSTYPVNISYPEFNGFDIIDVGAENGRVYDPIRLTMDDERMRANDQACEMSKEQVKRVIDSARKRLGKPTTCPKKTPEQEQQQIQQINPTRPQVKPGSAPQMPSLQPQKLDIPSNVIGATKSKPSKGFKDEVENLLKTK